MAAEHAPPGLPREIGRCPHPLVLRRCRRPVGSVASGVALDTWSLPAELHESHYGAPITHDDLLDFHAILEDEDLLAAALETIHGGR